MCGIASFLASALGLCDELIKHRGRDGFTRVECASAPWTLVSSVLHIQGAEVASQPARDSEGNLLLWNGEVFGGMEIRADASDTTCVMEKIAQVVAEQEDQDVSGVGAALVRVLSAIQGPFALIYFHTVSGTLFFARDAIGRRSLLVLREKEQLVHDKEASSTGTMCASSGGAIIGVSSVSLVPGTTPGDANAHGGLSTFTLEEVEPAGVYSLNVKEPQSAGDMQLFPWPDGVVRLGHDCCIGVRTIENASVSAPLHAVDSLPQPPQPSPAPTPALDRDACAASLLRTLGDAVGRRVRSMTSAHSQGNDVTSASASCSAPVGVLFSGGVDSAVLACLLHMHVAPHLSIDLINVCFLGPTATGRTDGPLGSPDRLSAIVAWRNIQTIFPHRTWNLVHVDVTQEERFAAEPHVTRLIAPCDTQMDLNIGLALWFGSRGRGYVRRYSEEEVAALHCVRHDGRPLLRVGAEGYRASRGEGGVQIKCDKAKHKKKGKCKGKGEGKGEGDGAVRENSTGGDEHRYNLGPGTQKEKGEEENNEERTRPTTSDNKDAEQIAAVDVDSWERGLGGVAEPAVTQVRALLVGIGADEQLAGYGRHRSCYVAGGEVALLAELRRDQQRLWRRNLGRDDRCISDHGRESWFPFLDEVVVRYLQELPLVNKLDLTLPPGEGDKRILRLAATSLGLTDVALFVKRAIQFGTRISKHTNKARGVPNWKAKGTSKI